MDVHPCHSLPRQIVGEGKAGSLCFCSPDGWFRDTGDVHGNGRGQRVMRVLRWQPSSYRQVWIYAVLGFGVPGFCIWAFVGHSLVEALIYAASITFFIGLGRSRRLNRDRNQGKV